MHTDNNNSFEQKLAFLSQWCKYFPLNYRACFAVYGKEITHKKSDRSANVFQFKYFTVYYDFTANKCVAKQAINSIERIDADTFFVRWTRHTKSTHSHRRSHRCCGIRCELRAQSSLYLFDWNIWIWLGFAASTLDGMDRGCMYVCVCIGLAMVSRIAVGLLLLLQ